MERIKMPDPSPMEIDLVVCRIVTRATDPRSSGMAALVELPVEACCRRRELGDPAPAAGDAALKLAADTAG